MGLTDTDYHSPALSTQDEPQLKYSYRFRIEAKQPDVFDEVESKAEVQSYINELLGFKEKPKEKDQRHSS
jgi:hypothetical protein